MKDVESRLPELTESERKDLFWTLVEWIDGSISSDTFHGSVKSVLVAMMIRETGNEELPGQVEKKLASMEQAMRHTDMWRDLACARFNELVYLFGWDRRKDDERTEDKNA